jgi:hypothetical protein
MTSDAELELWRREWLSDSELAAPVVDLRRKVERQSRQMRVVLLLQVISTVVVGGGYTAWAVLATGPGSAILVIGLWLLFALAWSHALLNRRGTWQPVDSATATFLELSLLRCRRRLSAANFGAVLYVVDVVFDLYWVFRFRSRPEPLPLGTFLTSGPVMVVWLGTLAAFGFLIWYKRKKRAELAYLLSLKRELQDE